MKKVKTVTLTSIAIMSAVLCVLGPMSISLPFSPVPLSLATIGIFLSLYVLGVRFGSLSIIIYLIIGLSGNEENTAPCTTATKNEVLRCKFNKTCRICMLKITKCC